MKSIYNYIYEALIKRDTKLYKPIIGFNEFSQLFEKETRITDLVPIEDDDFITIGETDLYRVTNKTTKEVLNYCYCMYVTYDSGDDPEYYQIVISRENENDIEIFIGWSDKYGKWIDGNQTYVLKKSPCKLNEIQYKKVIDFLEYSITNIQELDFDDPNFDMEWLNDYLQKYKKSI